MLFLKPIADLEFNDVAEFCSRFAENIRVEYKSTFDQSVKNKVPRVISGFANSYGGVLIIGVNAKNGKPELPIVGIAFEDPEPRLTVENICRMNILPEVPIYSKLVQSDTPGKAVFVIQVNESPRAPHAIENSTAVYIRSGDSTEPTKLADLSLIERLIQRRRDVRAAWSEFYEQSTGLAQSLGIRNNLPQFELKIGPLYPTGTVINREDVLTFVANHQNQFSLGFHPGIALRHPEGAILSNETPSHRYVNVGELATFHYIELLRHIVEREQVFTEKGPEWTEQNLFPFWRIVAPILRLLEMSAKLLVRCGITCELRIEATLRNVSNLPFTLSFDPQAFDTIPVSTIAPTVPASTVISSERLGKETTTVASELLYQLRWPLGTQPPHTRDEIAAIVAREAPSIRVKYP